jgi:superfamily II DNA or RNA helicase
MRAETVADGQARVSKGTRIGLARFLSPVRQPGILSLPDLDSVFSRPGVAAVDMLGLDVGMPTCNLCPSAALILSASVAIEAVHADSVLSVFTPLPKPGCAGKSYDVGEARVVQAPLPGPFRDEKCKHGLEVSWCAECSRVKAQSEATSRAAPVVNPFELIRPLLQPPLGDDFDNVVVFPVGKALLPFQRPGVKFLTEHEAALLGDEMGLGKSIQAITAVRFLFRLGKATSCLILCPLSVLQDWHTKLWEWAPELRVEKVRGQKDLRMLLWSTPAHVYLTTYDTLRQDIEELPKRQFDLVILDEIQKIKNPSAGITKAVRLINGKIRWGLSGTPLENRLEELISVFAYLKPGLLAYDLAATPRVVKQRIRAYLLRRKKTDVQKDLSLPEKVHEETWLELTDAQRLAYERAETEGVVEINRMGDAVTVQHFFALITKLKQICNVEVRSGESCKVDYLLDRLEDIVDQGEKVLVFSQYPEKTLRYVEARLKRYAPAIYSGSMTEAQRNRLIDRFQERDETQVLLMSVRAGGLGLTLHRANHVFHLDHWWNPAVGAQAEDRVHRIGQKRTVFVTTLFTVGTIEERIHRILSQKRALFREVIDDLSDRSLAATLSEDDLFALFGLKKRDRKATTEAGGWTVHGLKGLVGLDPRGFEELVYVLFRAMGYSVRLTGRTRDGGFDIEGKKVLETGEERIIIECKHYPHGTVGVDTLRELAGVLQRDIHKAYLVTSGRFSSECQREARDSRVELVDGPTLMGLMTKYGILRPTN